MKPCILLIILCIYNSIYILGQFAPPAGQPGSTAISHDSTLITGWATQCTIQRGYMDISNPSLGYTTVGDESSAIGPAGDGQVVSLGDGGIAIYTFETPLQNVPGWDFAVFENSFSNTYLELAFVEVSSDGINYVRFPATSLTQQSSQIGPFGEIDATHINNLAGKYRGLFGTPFDLEELQPNETIDIQSITHIKIIDVVGCIQSEYATYDHEGRIINDPWNTAFASGGFDLDALGIIQPIAASIEAHNPLSAFTIFPNPIQHHSYIQCNLSQSGFTAFSIYDLTGRYIQTCFEGNLSKGIHHIPLSSTHLSNGWYILMMKTSDQHFTQKICVTNE